MGASAERMLDERREKTPATDQQHFPLFVVEVDGEPRPCTMDEAVAVFVEHCFAKAHVNGVVVEQDTAGNISVRHITDDERRQIADKNWTARMQAAQ